jgi:hypothetical protein
VVASHPAHSETSITSKLLTYLTRAEKPHSLKRALGNLIGDVASQKDGISVGKKLQAFEAHLTWCTRALQVGFLLEGRALFLCYTSYLCLTVGILGPRRDAACRLDVYKLGVARYDIACCKWLDKFATKFKTSPNIFGNS